MLQQAPTRRPATPTWRPPPPTPSPSTSKSRGDLVPARLPSPRSHSRCNNYKNNSKKPESPHGAARRGSIPPDSLYPPRVPAARAARGAHAVQPALLQCEECARNPVVCVCVCVRARACVWECAPPRPLGSTTSSWCLSTALCAAAVGADVSSPRGPCAWARACRRRRERGHSREDCRIVRAATPFLAAVDLNNFWPRGNTWDRNAFLCTSGGSRPACFFTHPPERRVTTPGRAAPHSRLLAPTLSVCQERVGAGTLQGERYF